MKILIELSLGKASVLHELTLYELCAKGAVPPVHQELLHKILTWDEFPRLRRNTNVRKELSLLIDLITAHLCDRGSRLKDALHQLFIGIRLDVIITVNKPNVLPLHELQSHVSRRGGAPVLFVVRADPVILQCKLVHQLFRAVRGPVVH